MSSKSGYNKRPHLSISTDSSDDDGGDTSDGSSPSSTKRAKFEHYSDASTISMDRVSGFNPATQYSDQTDNMYPEAGSAGGGGGRGGLGSGSTVESSSDESTYAGQSAPINEYNYSDQSKLMMQRMGFKPDQGLGKLGQGRIDPVEASEQKGRRGLGLKLDGLDEAAVKFDPAMEHVQLRETVEWLTNSADDLDDLSRDELESWMVLGSTKLTIDDESKFCDPQILAEVLNSKSIFDNLGADDMRRARTRSNPFETIRGAMFLNRAAVKMANMDSIFDFMFTNPVDEDGVSLVRGDDLLYFADVCAGPGGFSEYVLWRKGWQAKGFGFTLRNENDFKLHDFFAGQSETFDPFYGTKEDGNVFDPANIESLAKYVLSQTQESGVHFMMADGGFSVEGQENVQEILSKQLYLCQCIVALSIVRAKGHFVVKLFDLFTPFSVGLIYLMYKCFQEICICKPNTSRPANSERYLVCKWKKANTDTIYRHLFAINSVMWKNPNSGNDFMELVPYEVMARDEKFFNYICDSNNTIGRNQIAGLLKIAAFCKDATLKETRQAEIRSECLSIWKIPEKMRVAPVKKSNEQIFNDLLGAWTNEKQFLSAPDKALTTKSNLEDIFRDPTDWYFVPVDTVENSVKTFRTLFMCKGGRDVLMYEANGTWSQIRDICLELSPNTLIYGEIAKELTGEGRSQTVVHALHIIDGIVLGGVDIRNMPLRKRLQMCEKFAAALNKPNKVITSRDGTTQSFIAPISCKKLYPLREFGAFFDRLNHYKLKDGRMRYGLPLRKLHGPQRFFVPRGLVFFNELKTHLTKAFSRSHQKVYYIDRAKNHTFYKEALPDPNVVYASFRTTYTNRKLWAWEVEDQVNEELKTERLNNLVYRIDFDRFLQMKTNESLLQ